VGNKIAISFTKSGKRNGVDETGGIRGRKTGKFFWGTTTGIWGGGVNSREEGA